MDTSPLALAPRLERAEAVAMTSVYRDGRASGVEAVGARQTMIAGASVTAITVLDSAFFNRVVGLGSQGPVTRDDVAAISAYYRSIGLGESMIQVPREVMTPDIEGWLTEAGYVRGRNWVKLWHPLDEVRDAETSLRIAQVGPDEADAFASIVVDAMEFPPEVGPLAAAVVGVYGWRHYLGYDGDTPVAATAMFIDGETAWFGFGATLAAARGRGGQSAMFAARLRDARDLGCTLAVTETGEETPEDPVNPSYRNMLRAGFTLAYARPNWVRREAAPSP
jgi:GNAT superfamily N-acetyltransferase